MVLELLQEGIRSHWQGKRRGHRYLSLFQRLLASPYKNSAPNQAGNLFQTNVCISEADADATLPSRHGMLHFSVLLEGVCNIVQLKKLNTKDIVHHRASSAMSLGSVFVARDLCPSQAASCNTKEGKTSQGQEVGRGRNICPT